MRIAVISRVFSRTGGGAESYTVAIAEQLAQRHEIHVFAQDFGHPLPGVHYHKVVCLGRRPRWINQIVFSIASWWHTRIGFDVVHSHENTWHGQVQTIHVRPIRGNLLFADSAARRVLQWLKIALSPRLMTYIMLEGARFRMGPMRKVVATSENLRIECEQAYPQCKNAVTVIEPATGQPQNSLTKFDARSQLGMPQDGKWVLFVANDYARKGLDALLKAMTALPSDIRLMVVGNPKNEPKYRQLAQQLGLQERVHFLGSLEKIAYAYWAADCLAHPTLEDSFAMVVLEAMAHGLPVIVSGAQYCGISRQLTDGEQVLLLPDPNDAQFLAKHIGSVLNQPQLSQSLRSQGLAFAGKYSWPRAALQYEQLYLQVASKP